MDGCLFVYPDNEWSAFEDKLRELPLTNKKARDFKRFFLGSAVDGELDKQGRVLISSALRAYAGLEKEVVLAGVLDKIEIWTRKPGMHTMRKWRRISMISPATWKIWAFAFRCSR